MVEVCKVCSDPDCMVLSLGYGYHCQNMRGDPPTKCFAFKEARKEKCSVCEEAGFYSDVGSEAEPKSQSSQRTPTQTVRYQPPTPASKKRKSVTAVATVVSNNINTYWARCSLNKVRPL